MINSASKYKFVDIPDGVVINGGILPARDVAGNGGWMVLRGEDKCFLAESAARLYRYQGIDEKFDVDRWVSASGFGSEVHVRSIQRGIRQTGASGRSWAAPIAIDGASASYESDWWYVKDVSQYGHSPQNRVDACLSAATRSLETEWAEGAVPEEGHVSPLSADGIRRLFYDLRMNVCQFSGGITPRGSSSTTRTSVTYDGTDTVTDTMTYQLPYGIYDASNFGATGWSYDTYEWTIGEVEPSGGSGFLAGLTPFVWLFVLVLVDHVPAANASTIHYFDEFVVRAAVNSSGNIVVPHGSLSASTIRSAAMSARSLPATTGEMEVGEKVGIDFSFDGKMYFDQDIYTGSIDWKWKPDLGA